MQATLTDAEIQQIAERVSTILQSKSIVHSAAKPRMRTYNEAIEAVHKADPGTCITRHTIMSLAADGKIASVMVGNKRLINLDSLESYLSQTSTPVSNEANSSTQNGYGKIRRISE